MDTYRQATQVSHDSWEDICNELVDFGANASQADLHLLMGVCSMHLEDNVRDDVILPEHLQRYGGRIELVRFNPIALRNIWGMLQLFSDLQMNS